MLALYIAIGCWILFGIYWLISAFTQKKAAERPVGTLNNIIAQIFFALPFPLLVRPDWFNLTQTMLSGAVVQVLAVLCSITGLLTCIWARRTLAGNWSKNIDFKKDHELVQKGPYAQIRHPIYTGFLLLYLGSALAYGRLGGIIGFAVLILGCYLRIRQEEALMQKHFGSRYNTYKAKTKALIPYVI